MIGTYSPIAFAALLAGVAAGEAGTSDQGRSSSLQRYESIRQFVAKEADRLWRGLGSAPFDILLIGPSDEQLYCRQPLPAGFTASEREPVTGCSAAARARSGLPAGLLAAMPAFGPPSTIIMGTPQSTGRSDADWTRTILHEHFHQWQDALPGFYGRIAKLDLSGGDQTGMWMLNYPFPYSEPRTVAAFAGAAKSLGAALDARGKRGFRNAFARYLGARRRLQQAVGEKDWRYAEFELWKEGIARWTEIELGKRFPDPAVRASARRLEQQTRAWLDKPDIARSGREFVYPFGAGEAMLLEACGAKWRRTYPTQLALGPMLENARRSCRG